MINQVSGKTTVTSPRGSLQTAPRVLAELEAPTPSPVDTLPDLSQVMARAAQEAQETGDSISSNQDSPASLSVGKKAVLVAAGVATAGVALMGAAPQAQAGQFRQIGRGPEAAHHHLVSQDAGEVLGNILLGVIIGGAIVNGMQQAPVYHPPAHPQQSIQRPYYDNHGRLICPTSHGGWYVSADPYECRSSRW